MKVIGYKITDTAGSITVEYEYGSWWSHKKIRRSYVSKRLKSIEEWIHTIRADGQDMGYNERDLIEKLLKLAGCGVDLITMKILDKPCTP